MAMAFERDKMTFRGVCVRAAALVALVAAPPAPLQAQADGTCIPLKERAGRLYGCFITAREELGALPVEPPLYWHLDTYPTVSAAKADMGPRGTVVESLGRIWLFTIAPADFRPTDGARIATIGPLPLVRATAFSAVYMESVAEAGMSSVVHRHPGVEAWYTIAGSMCVETPRGKLEQHAGDPGVLVAGGVPMVLTGTGTGPRRSVVLILQDASLPRSTPAHDWKPSGICGHGSRRAQ